MTVGQGGGWKIIAIEGNRALIESDDGRRAWAPRPMGGSPMSLSQGGATELTDGERIFVMTGEVNQHGYRRADVARVTATGREKGWLPGCRVWLVPEAVEQLREVENG
jgi:hypothetical protein